MAKILDFLATATLAVFVCSFAVQPGAAISTRHLSDSVLARHSTGNHDLVAQRKRAHRRARRGNSPVCKTRDASSTSKTATPTSTSTKKKAAATSTHEAAAAAATKTASTKSSSKDSPCPNKTGFSWNMGDKSELATWSSGGGRCVYTWSSWPLQKATDAGSVVLPMLWGNSEDHISEFKRNIKDYSDDTLILTFNEPDQPTQADMSVSDAISTWWDHIEPQIAKGHRACAPAVSSAPAGFTWIKDFIAGCDGCNIACVTTHYYGTSADDFIAYQKKFLKEFDLPILVTEFACNNFGDGPNCTPSEAKNFLETTTAWMDGEDKVWSYMAFGSLKSLAGVTESDRLLDASTLLPNALGKDYLNNFS